MILKSYPAYRMAKSDGARSFWRLFRHIKAKKIAMTAPVTMTMEETEAGLRQIDMAFLYGKQDLGTPGRDGEVKVLDREAGRVLSIALRGPVTKEKIAAAKKAIEAAAGNGYERKGDWRLLGYNSPMVPAGRRTYELQLPVTAKAR